MSTGGETRYTFTADSSQLQAEMRKAQGAIDQTGATATASANRIDDGFKRAEQSAGKLGSSAKKLRGGLASLSPEAAAVAGAVDDAADAVEVFAAVGPAGAAAGAALAATAAVLYAQYVVWNREQERAAAFLEFTTAHAHDLDAAMRTLEDATLAAAVATGKLTEEEGKLAAIRDEAVRSVEDFQRAQEEERRALEDAAFAAQRSYERWETGIGILDTAIDYYGGYSATIEDSTRKLDALDAIDRKHQETAVATAAAKEEETKAEGKKTRATKASTKAVEESEKALRLQAEALKASQAAMAEDAALDASFAAGLQKITEATTASADSRLKGEAAVQAALAATTAEYLRQYQALLVLAATDEQRIAATEAYQAAITEAERAAAAERIEIAKDEEEAKRDARQAGLGAAADIFGSLAELSSSLSDRMSAEQKQAAMDLFAVQKAAGLAQAGINTAMAVSNALATPGVPYPVAVLMAVSAGIAGAAQVAAIASEPPPTFNDTPGVQRVGGSGRGMVNLAGGDFFAAAQTPEGLAAQVGGGGGGAQYIVIGSRAFGARIRDDVRQNTPLARAVRGSTWQGLGTRRRAA